GSRRALGRTRQTSSRPGICGSHRGECSPLRRGAGQYGDRGPPQRLAFRRASRGDGGVAGLVLSKTAKSRAGRSMGEPGIDRALRPAGGLAFIVPTDLFGEALLRPHLLRAVGLRRRAERARESVLRDTDTFNRFSRERWCELVKQSGLELSSVTSFMPPRTIR